MGFTYKVLQERYKGLRKEITELSKELTNYKYLYKEEKEKVDKLRKKIEEKDIIIDMLYREYYK